MEQQRMLSQNKLLELEIRERYGPQALKSGMPGPSNPGPSNPLSPGEINLYEDIDELVSSRGEAPNLYAFQQSQHSYTGAQASSFNVSPTGSPSRFEELSSRPYGQG